MIVTPDGSCRYEAVKRYRCFGRQYRVSDFTVSLAGYDILYTNRSTEGFRVEIIATGAVWTSPWVGLLTPSHGGATAGN